MSTVTAPPTSETTTHPRLLSLVPSARRERLRDPAFQAYLVLRIGFVAAPFLFGLDKFFNWMTYWPKYLWIGFPNLISVSPQHFMYGVGVVEMLAGVLVLLLPRLAPWVVAGWLGGIVTDLVVKSIAVGGHTAVYWDIALRDFGLMLAAIALARLSAAFAPSRSGR
jgi:uncharacterized membrane protein YphA (DoxX/SURF4 family)